ncbi:MAG: hypothetical protein SVX43_21405, partial [Cyanobacteriota bacterium]|nr:hypothetical protein [Cyanobacteriota bacterium]
KENPQRVKSARRKSPRKKGRDRDERYAAVVAEAKRRFPHFPFGTIVKRGQRQGLVIARALSPGVQQLWVLWESKSDFKVYEKYPHAELLDDSLTLVAERPKPSLPRYDSPTSEPPAEVVGESSDKTPPCSLQKYYPQGEARGYTNSLNADYR